MAVVDDFILCACGFGWEVFPDDMGSHRPAFAFLGMALFFMGLDLVAGQQVTAILQDSRKSSL